MDRAERARVREFVADYDHGRTATDIKIPEFVVETLRTLVEAVAPTDAIPCAQCGEEATWEAGGRSWCDDHPAEENPSRMGIDDRPIDAGGVWQTRYLRLLADVDSATTISGVQEMRSALAAALSKDVL